MQTAGACFIQAGGAQLAHILFLARLAAQNATLESSTMTQSRTLHARNAQPASTQLLVQQPAQSVHMGQRTLTMILLHRAPGVALELTVHLVQPHASSVLLARLTRIQTPALPAWAVWLVNTPQPDPLSASTAVPVNTTMWHRASRARRVPRVTTHLYVQHRAFSVSLARMMMTTTPVHPV